MEETIRLKVEETGRIKIIDIYPEDKNENKHRFSTPDSNGKEFGRLFKDLKKGDELEITFKNVRICSHCGQKLKKKSEK